MTDNATQHSLLISATALMLLQSGSFSYKRAYQRIDAQFAGLLLPGDPGYIPPWMYVTMVVSGWITLATSVALFAWFVFRGPFSWWWHLPLMFIGSGVAAWPLLPMARKGNVLYVLGCYHIMWFATVALWIHY